MIGFIVGGSIGFCVGAVVGAMARQSILGFGMIFCGIAAQIGFYVGG